MARLRPLLRWIGASWARLSYSHFTEPVWLEVNKIDVPVLPAGHPLVGLRILHLTDFHLCSRVPAAFVRQAVDRGRREQADLVALTGDFIHSGFHHVEAAARIVGRLEAPLGVYAVLGNHDYAVRNKFGLSRKPKLAEAVRTALEARRIRVLENENVVVRHRKAPLAVAGVADLWSRDCDLPKALAGLTAETPRVLLAHNPFTAESLAGAR
ncbi:MAG: metallophosphoesterase, partial [Planctomycetia bacterium]